MPSFTTPSVNMLMIASNCSAQFCTEWFS